MIDFQTPAQQACYGEVKGWLQEMFGEMVSVRDDAPAFVLTLGSALVQTFIVPWGNDDATVTARSYVIRNIDVTPELMHFLLRENDKMRFGSFGLDNDNDVFFEHTIVGSSLDKAELKATVLAVVSTADNYDDKIKAQWGGLRAADG